jgi:hypothetical protein
MKLVQITYLYLISVDLPLFLYPATVLLGILYLINTHTLDGQHKASCHRQQC